MINLALDELRLIAQNRNIRDYENKPEEDLIKALSEPKPKLRINKKKLEEIRKDFNELRHKFPKKEVDKYRKTFYDIKNYGHLSTSEIEEARKNLIELRKVLGLKSFMVMLMVLIRRILLMMMNTEELVVLEDYLKTIITN